MMAIIKLALATNDWNMLSVVCDNFVIWISIATCLQNMGFFLLEAEASCVLSSRIYSKLTAHKLNHFGQEILEA
jgi:hypothetical protein